MFTLKSGMKEILENKAVLSFLKSSAPQIISGPARDYIAALSPEQLISIQPEMEQLIQAVLDIANGKDTDYQPVDLRKQKPILRSGVSSVYNVDDVDGMVYMLDHDFSGCYSMQFSKEMDPTVPGRITYNGKELKWFLKRIAAAGDLQMLGVFVRDICSDYDTDYVLQVEGFADTDGNVMDPEKVVVHTAAKGEADPEYEEHDRIAQRAAEEGIVLLKNEDNFLPLSPDARIAVVGERCFRDGAVGAGKINPRYTIRLGRALEESSFCLDKNADTLIYVISRASGENYDNGAFPGQYYLTAQEQVEITALKEKYNSIIAVINSGYPMDIQWTKDKKVKAVIWTGYPGMLGGRALVNILNGTVNPSGRLSDTWANDYYDIPSSRNFYMPETAAGALDADHDVWIDTVYEEDIYVGYRYFETFHKEVAYPFGYGLSYTTFDIQSQMRHNGENLSFDIKVTNTGNADGCEVVQIYAHIPDGKLEQPALRLVGFCRTKALEPGESQKLTVNIPEDRISSFSEEMSAFLIEEGTYSFYIGVNVRDTKLAGCFNKKKEKLIRIVGDYMKPPISFTRLSKNDSSTEPSGKLSGILESVHALQHRSVRTSVPDCEILDYPEIDSWNDEELARFSVCASAGWGMHDIGVAGRVYRLKDRNIPYYAVADGNNGVNINRKNIGMPTSNLVCCSWDTELAYEIGRVIAEEAKENDVQMILAPAMNIHRNPLCGRHSEYFSEDPLLAGMMAGYQGKGLEENDVGSSVKHVCCNGSEATRKRNHSILSQRALREIYLRAFEVAFQVYKPCSIMTAYNACNGVFTAEDEELLLGIFRNEFGFKGFIMTDWNSYDTADIATAVQAGVSWFTPGSSDNRFTAKILEGLHDGTIRRGRLVQNVKYMYRVVADASREGTR